MTGLDDLPGVLVNLPAKLHFLIGPALKYGRHQFPEDIHNFAAHATSQDRETLQQVREKLSVDDNYEEVELFLDKFSMKKHSEAARLYFLQHVIDAVLGEVPPVVRTHDDLVRDNVKQLTRFGSPRLAALRMWAARWFAMSPPIPQIAVPALDRACDDESFHVRVWAHGAMAMITGQSDNHIRAIETIVAQVPPNHEQAIFIRGDAARVIDLVRARSSETP